MATWVAVFTLLSVVVATSPQVNFPLSLQFPPVAHVGQKYSFQFAPTTFQSESGNLQYSLIGNPKWLSLNSYDRTLYGTPTTNDIGNATFTIAAAGEAGAVANMESKLLVTADEGPRMNTNIIESLSKAGQLSGPNSVAVLPMSPFEITFPSDPFDANGKKLSYYVTLGDHTPLPSWISFDATSLRLAGTSPPTDTPLSFDILLIASDTPKFSASSVPFTLLVSPHQLLFKPPSQVVNLTKGSQISISGLRGKLFLDNNAPKDWDIKSSTAKLPNWLSFNNKTFDITGTAPPKLMSQDVNITVKDNYGDTATYWIHFVFGSEVFTSEIGKLNITAGEHYEYKIPKAIFAQDDTEVTIDFGALGRWLKFDPSSLTIIGMIPDDFDAQDVEGSMTATANSPDGVLKDTQTFQLHVSAVAALHPSQTSTQAGAEPTNKIENTASAHESHSDGSRAGIIVGSVIAAIFVIVMLLALIFFLYHRKKKKAEGYTIARSTPKSSPRKSEISRPIIIADQWRELDGGIDEGIDGGVDGDKDTDLEKGKDDEISIERTPEQPPQIEIDLPTKRKETPSIASTIGDGETKILTAFDRSSWGFKDESGPSHRPHESMKIPTQMARRIPEKSESPHRHKRQITTVYRDQIHRSSGLPVNRRITGLGHGRYTYSPSRSNTFSTLRRRLSYSSRSTRSTSILSTVPSAFPQSPTARHTTQLTTPLEKRRSIRLVPASRCNSILDHRTIDEKRNSYIRKRASAVSPFFSAGSSRGSSSSYKAPPAFISEAQSATQSASNLLPTSSTDKLSDEATQKEVQERSDSLQIRRPSETPSVETPKTLYPGSLRKNRPNRTHTAIESLAASGRYRIQKLYDRPGTAVYPSLSASRRSSLRNSLRAHELKSSLNSLTGSKIYEDAEMSESVYSTEEEDIEQYENRSTIKPNQYMLPPLNLTNAQKNKQHRRSNSSRSSRHVADRKIQRESTIYSLELEPNSNEKRTSTYSLEKSSTTVSREKSKSKATTSPERPQTAIGMQRQTRPPYHSRTESRISQGGSTQESAHGRPVPQRDSIQGPRPIYHTRPTSRTSQVGSMKGSLHGRPPSVQSRPPYHARTDSHKSRGSTRDSSYGRPPSQRESIQERHSRKSLHSRSQSRQSLLPKQPRDRSRTQSSAYPHFDPSILETSRASIVGAETTSAQKEATNSPSTPISPSVDEIANNTTAHAQTTDNKVEEHPSKLNPNPNPVRISQVPTGRVRSAPRQSQQGHLRTTSQSHPSYKRDTTISTPTPIYSATPNTNHTPVGLGLNFSRSLRTVPYSHTVPAQQPRSIPQSPPHQRQPLGVITGENGSSPNLGPDRLRPIGAAVTTGGARVASSASVSPSGLRTSTLPTSNDADDGDDETKIKGRKTWGGLKAAMGRSSITAKGRIASAKWDSMWDKEKKEDKAFL